MTSPIARSLAKSGMPAAPPIRAKNAMYIAGPLRRPNPAFRLTVLAFVALFGDSYGLRVSGDIASLGHNNVTTPLTVRRPLLLPLQNARTPTQADCHQAWGWTGKPAWLTDSTLWRNRRILPFGKRLVLWVCLVRVFDEACVSYIDDRICRGRGVAPLNPKDAVSEALKNGRRCLIPLQPTQGPGPIVTSAG